MLLSPSRCACCGSPGPVVCRSCAHTQPAAPRGIPPAGLDSLHVPDAYEGPARALVLGLKAGDRWRCLPWLADRLAGGWSPPRDAVLTWAPTAGGRRRRRGFDQAELLARALARRWDRPCGPLLRRRPGAAQAQRGRASRLAHPGFVARRAPATVVVVDDVVTTGATLRAAALALRGAGAGAVHGVAAARA